MIPGVNIISGKASVESVNWAGEVWRHSELSVGILGAETTKKILGSKEHPDWLKIDLNAAKLITVQEYKHTNCWRV